MNHTLKKNTLIFIGVFLVALFIRLPGLGSFMTADEANWMVRSGEFWNNLFLNNDPGGTFRTSHPGVLTMWLSGGGVFFEELRLGYHIDQSNLADFRLAAVLPIAVATSLLIALIGLQFSLLYPQRQYSFLPALFLALDPYLTGMSQIVHLDALLALCMVSSLLQLCLYVKEEEESRKIRYLIFSGIIASGAFLNKFLPALWLVPLMTSLLFFSIPGSFFHRLRIISTKLLLLFGVSGLVFYLLWPTLLVMKNTTQYFTNDAVSIATVDHVDISASDDPIQGSFFYLRTTLGRTSPFILILALTIGIITVSQAWRQKKIEPFSYLFLYSISYLLFISVISKKADRYALPSLVVWPLLSGFGIQVAMNVIKNIRIYSLPNWFFKTLPWALVLALGIQTFSWSPYAIAYDSPLFPNIRLLSQQGWGEGLDEAAALLNTYPFGKQLSVASWYPTVFETYYKGDTYSLSSRDDQRVGMVVLYRNMQGRGPDDEGTNLWDEYKNQKPWQVLSIHNKPYVYLYRIVRVRNFPKTTAELIGSSEVGQLLSIEDNNWSSIDIGLATYSSRANNQDVTVHIRSDATSSQDIRTITRNAKDILDSDWNTFAFEPITNSAEKTFFVSITSPTSTPGNAIAVRYSNEDIQPGQLFVLPRTEKNISNRQVFLRTGDMAYRIP